MKKITIESFFDHFNFNVKDLQKSLDWYREALGLHEVKRKEAPDGSYILVYLGDNKGGFRLELTWLRDWDRPYNLGDNEYHLCMRVAGDYDEVRAYHKAMNCVCFENEKMGLYFISDPDGYWIEILPVK
ncbi:VOC family protein [Porphyromonas pogonae]|uniref:VOC family protein n=1 Tax=Porphyromonas pogonae TaxID=867595 RepID=UPI0038B59049